MEHILKALNEQLSSLYWGLEYAKKQTAQMEKERDEAIKERDAALTKAGDLEIGMIDAKEEIVGLKKRIEDYQND